MPDRPRDRMDDAIGEFASPACAMHEADDVYMGYAGKDELIALLRELLASERAIASIASESRAAAGASALTDLLQRIAHGAALRCATLAHRLQSLGGTLGGDVNPLHAEAMAIADLAARIICLGRGEDRLQRELTAMREAQEADLAAISAVSGRVPEA